ncbi:TAXI family TRAP transporter solute-binding subunit [Corynebacterium sp. 153RC1]|uniref:TAXI family TRAP transporter solute-binding subunit n=1 Tax=Corynebacterium TaxID=1716 RepID=UPI00211B961E|nr:MULTISPECIES: TAXI family TRAP transporter solute-binding subunit [unclassified Corynebacterium]MCQ9343004.1 TAXI family TRAP transporter solute-binding subunit [Corynebacterium sp. 76QC2CO]MCQ9352719.1 TAXI family TRAP transporter solute-binding subunit [Corynebacterium sp. 209RC1]MCQ9354903.1 TAXI family TRAP transporter solute-binding subunit [Corynebacterium sp. 1222RC1]MCQ9357088.1 TAXI family TRAP transporter solute-binding subunit [Corynebacterium sp. 122RC1]MCQ9359334.1 TAXI family 
MVTSRPMSRRRFLQGVAATFAATALASCARDEQTREAGFPKNMVWSTFAVGSSTYAVVASLGNVISRSTGTQVRLMTGDTGIARMAPLFSGVANYARVGDESLQVFEGSGEFASEAWGPKPVRLLWTPSTKFGMAVKADSDIYTLDDLRGKKVPRFVAMAPTNKKMSGFLNIAGMDWEDVQPITITGMEQFEALKTGQIDVIYANVVGASIEEVASRYDLRWLDMGAYPPENYTQLVDKFPMGRVVRAKNLPGQDPEQEAGVMETSLPMVVREDLSEEEVYAVTNLFVDRFDEYKNVTTESPAMSIDQLVMTPLFIPFHKGVVRVLKERGKWTDALDVRNQALLERERIMQEAWPGFWAEHGSKPHAETSAMWDQWRAENLPELPKAEART